MALPDSSYARERESRSSSANIRSAPQAAPRLQSMHASARIHETTKHINRLRSTLLLTRMSTLSAPHAYSPRFRNVLKYVSEECWPSSKPATQLQRQEGGVTPGGNPEEAGMPTTLAAQVKENGGASDCCKKSTPIHGNACVFSGHRLGVNDGVKRSN